jgi:hypothetical protein
MKRITLALSAILLASCASTTTPAQRAEREKQVAHLEGTGWKVARFVGDLTAKVITGTAANLVRERGFAK